MLFGQGEVQKIFLKIAKASELQILKSSLFNSSIVEGKKMNLLKMYTQRNISECYALFFPYRFYEMMK